MCQAKFDQIIATRQRELLQAGACQPSADVSNLRPMRRNCASTQGKGPLFAFPPDSRRERVCRLQCKLDLCGADESGCDNLYVEPACIKQLRFQKRDNHSKVTKYAFHKSVKHLPCSLCLTMHACSLLHDGRPHARFARCAVLLKSPTAKQERGPTNNSPDGGPTNSSPDGGPTNSSPDDTIDSASITNTDINLYRTTAVPESSAC